MARLDDGTVQLLRTEAEIEQLRRGMAIPWQEHRKRATRPAPSPSGETETRKLQPRMRGEVEFEVS
jgi:hypothetical protein